MSTTEHLALMSANIRRGGVTMITILVHYGNMTVCEGRLSGSRLVWRAAGLYVYVLGTLTGDKLHFEQACNLAVNACIERHIPAVSLRYQKSSNQKSFASTNVDMYKKGLL